MKKLLLSLALIPSAVFGVHNDTENLIKFIDMEQKHKQDWLDYEQAKFNKEMEMIKKHNSQLIKLAQDFPSKVVARQQLRETVKLHEDQNNDWAKMCEANMKEATDLAKKHEIELSQFKKALMPAHPAGMAGE